MEPVFPQNLAHLLHGAAFMFFIMLSIHLFPERKKNAVVDFLFWEIVVLVLLLTKDFCDLGTGIWQSEYIINLSASIDMCMLPMIIIFTIKILTPRWLNRQRMIVMFIPSILFTLAYAITANEYIFLVMFVYTAVFALAGAYYAFTGSLHYDFFLKNNYSNIENKNLSWIRGVTVILAIWYTLYAIFSWQDSWWADAIYYVFLILLWAVIYYFSIHHTIIADAPDIRLTLPWTKIKQKPEEDEPVVPAIARDLAACMQKDELWLNPTLTLNDLSKAIGTNRTYLSAYLNNSLQTTFYDYLNTYRIEKACALLASRPARTLEEISEQSGFNSLSTFRRAFYKIKNCTPAQFRQIAQP